jgi:hypothetical protein
LTIDAASMFSNSSGALHTTGGTFDVHNTMFFNNGSGNLQSSPVWLESGTGSFSFNTVTHNVVRGNGSGNFASGVECTNNLPIPGNIVVDNSGRAQTVNCNINNTRTGGTGQDVMFVVFPPMSAADLHLQPASPAINFPGLDCSTVKTDIDGEPRPMPAGPDHCDQGADEYKE